ncbi:MAG: SPOR domain-containing protein [Pseudomonadales bacterium]|nr:SPOR domain-containing protein [Pseudomonadales bacterium]
MENDDQIRPEPADGNTSSPLSKVDGLKQRLVGAVVLVSLAVIFLPMIFEEPHQEKKNIVIPIPDRPPEKIINISAPKAPSLRKLDETAQSIPDVQAQPSMDVAPSDGQVYPGNTAPDLAVNEDVLQASIAQKQEAISQETTSQKTTSQKSTSQERNTVHNSGDASQSDQSGVNTPVSKAAETVEKASPAIEKTPPITNTTPAAGNLVGKWVVQLGTFGNQNNAYRLRDEAVQRGYSTQVVALDRSGTTLLRVLTGPFANRDAAEKAKTGLSRQLNVKPMVVEYAE